MLAILNLLRFLEQVSGIEKNLNIEMLLGRKTRVRYPKLGPKENWRIPARSG